MNVYVLLTQQVLVHLHYTSMVYRQMSIYTLAGLERLGYIVEGIEDGI